MMKEEKEGNMRTRDGRQKRYFEKGIDASGWKRRRNRGLLEIERWNDWMRKRDSEIVEK
jgi:hypothetical protein